MAMTQADIKSKQYGGQMNGRSAQASHYDMYKVFTRKTFLVAWRRWRFQSAIIQPTIHSSLHLGLWILLDELISDDWGDKTKLMLVLFRTITPLFLAMSAKTVMEKMVLELVTEKESKMKIVQLVNGLPPWVYWVSYTTYFCVASFFAVLAWSIMLCATCFSGANFVLVFLMLYLGFLQIFFAAIMTAAVFDQAKTASNMAGGVLVLSFLPIGLSMLESLPSFAVLLLGFLPNCALVFWSQAMLMLSVKEQYWGFNDNFLRPAKTLTPDTFGVQELPSPGLIFLFFFVQLLAGALLAYWVDQTWQGQYGAARTLCFCCKRQRYPPKAQQPSAELLGKADVEAPAEGKWALGSRPLEISHLTKIFRSVKRDAPCKKSIVVQTAVDDVTLDVQGSELFALLGHNGAGKTTIINCITGMMPVTSGEVKVLGLSCITDIQRCRWNMSICPQDNPMYDEMTVDEHLLFFAGLRGTQNGPGEVSQVLEALGLLEKRIAKCGTLSGGQKRRLWVATSLLGDAPLVFLDEPTSGMDPSSRRELWTLLLGMKHRGRSILFTTHYLEEADLLADRKAVLAKGKVKAIGTSKELKTQFGTGYHLRIMMPHSAPPNLADQVTELVQQLVTGATREKVAEVERTQSSDAPVELRYTLPYAAVDSFGPLFLALDARTEELQVLDFELAMTSLEEVFMALGKEVDGDSASDLEFQQLEQEREESGKVMLSKRDYIKLMWIFRTEQLRTVKKALFGTVVFPVMFSVYAVLSSTGFGSAPGKLMQRNFPMFPGFIAAIASLRLIYCFIEEREQKIRHVMISMGMPRDVYWNVTLCHNALQVCLVLLITPFSLHIAGEACVGDGRAIFVWLAALLHCIPMSLFFYLMTFFYKNAENATKLINLLNLVAGMFLMMVPGICWNMGLTGTGNMVGELVHTIYSFLNPYYLLPGVLLGVWRAGGGDVYECADVAHQTYEECAGIPKDAGLGYFMGHWVFWAPWVGQTFLCIVLYAACHRMDSPAKQKSSATAISDEARRDQDVLAEEERVRDRDPAKEACLYRNLHHIYYDKERTVHAVRGISLGIQHGECFGLLGPNGAGKTTTLGCLTGEIRPPTMGEVYVAGHSVTGNDAEAAYKHLGYCPQIDPLFGDSTGRQHLMFYGALKGIPPNELAGRVDDLFQRLGFEVADRDKFTKQYSGGMKRKLSLGIALIGPSRVLFLDEPSAAVDAGAKRLLWQAIKMRAASKTVVLTTHSMEEAEAVCDRIAIQVMGALRCLGTPIHLKTMYGKGYQLEVRLKKAGQAGNGAQIDRLTGFVKSAFSNDCLLLESHEDFIVYQLPRFKQGGLSLGSVFTKLQQARQQYDIEDYSMSQPTLEQVFLRFAKEQQMAASGPTDIPSTSVSNGTIVAMSRSTSP
mmetsp:Transcript_142195/g.246108  ORF Transcript_142195/g.246108 Transcript_142195/m.246108 type:complete len:1392 (+) Transcript_142195:71-4246(+)